MTFEFENECSSCASVIGAQATGQNQQEIVYKLLDQAQENANRQGEVPSLIILSSGPGKEEELLKAIESFFNTGAIPLISGGCADNTTSGHWWCANEQECIATTPILLTLIYSSEFYTYSLLSSGSQPTGKKGVITSAEHRTIHTIDNQNAAQVYNQWTEGLISEELELEENVSILQKTALWPIGRQTSPDKPIEHLIHPEGLINGSLRLFAEIHTGEEASLMSINKDNLIKRPHHILKNLMQTQNINPEKILSCILIFCGGCRLSLGNDISKVQQELQKHYPYISYITFFSYGEKSQLHQELSHSNLMISINLFTAG